MRKKTEPVKGKEKQTLTVFDIGFGAEIDWRQGSRCGCCSLTLGKAHWYVVVEACSNVLYSLCLFAYSYHFPLYLL